MGENEFNKLLGLTVSSLNIIHIFKTEKQLADFLYNILIQIPGIDQCTCCINGVHFPTDSLPAKSCNCPVKNKSFSTSTPHYNCNFQEKIEYTTIPILTQDKTYGHIIIKTDPHDFHAYKPFIYNLINFVGLSIENKYQKEKLYNDVETLKKTKENLINSEQRLLTLLESIADEIFLHDLNGRFLLVNEAACVNTGYQRDELLRMSVKDLDPCSDAREDFIKYWPKIVEGDSIQFFTDHKRRDGTLYPVEISLNGIQMPEGQAIIAVARDITERKHTEEALKKNEEKYRRLFNSINDGICLHEMIYEKSKPVDYRILDVNPKFEELTGISRNQAIGATASHIYKTDNAPYLEVYSDVVSTGTNTSFETYFSPIEKHFLISVFSPAQNQFATVFQDITDRKRAEESLRQSQELLEKRVKERTKELELNKKSLEETNVALNVLLKKRDQDKNQYENNIMFNVRKLIKPQIENLKKSGLSNYQKNHLNALESFIKEITSDFSNNLQTAYQNLTISEIEVANLIKNGKTTKEIAYTLNKTHRAVEFHRQSIRKKLGLRNKKINLASHLISLQK